MEAPSDGLLKCMFMYLTKNAKNTSTLFPISKTRKLKTDNNNNNNKTKRHLACLVVTVSNEEREKHFDVISNSKNTKSKNRQQQQQQHQKTSCLSCGDSEVLGSSFCSHTTLEQRKILEISLRCHPKQNRRDVTSRT